MNTQSQRGLASLLLLLCPLPRCCRSHAPAAHHSFPLSSLSLLGGRNGAGVGAAQPHGPRGPGPAPHEGRRRHPRPLFRRPRRSRARARRSRARARAAAAPHRRGRPRCDGEGRAVQGHPHRVMAACVLPLPGPLLPMPAASFGAIIHASHVSCFLCPSLLCVYVCCVPIVRG